VAGAGGSGEGVFRDTMIPGENPSGASLRRGRFIAPLLHDESCPWGHDRPRNDERFVNIPHRRLPWPVRQESVPVRHIHEASMQESYRELAPVIDYDSILHRDITSERSYSAKRWANTSHHRTRWPLRREELLLDESDRKSPSSPVTRSGDTLVAAISRQDIGEVSRLVRGGAPLFAKYNLDTQGLNMGTVLELAQSKRDERMAMQLLALPHYGPHLARVSTRAVNWAARDGQLHLLKALLAARADVAQQDTWERSALLLSAMHGHTECASELMEAGAGELENHKTEVRQWLAYWDGKQDHKPESHSTEMRATYADSGRLSLTRATPRVDSRGPGQQRKSYN